MKLIKVILLFLVLLSLNAELYGQIPQPGIDECVMGVSPQIVSFPISGGSKYISVLKSDRTCTYSAVKSASWLSIQDVGSTGFTVVCPTNTTTDGPRSATILVSGMRVAISQDGIKIAGFGVTGGGSYCSGGSGVNIGISGSETGVSYTLSKGETTLRTLSGTGAALDFGKQKEAGTYIVVGTKSGLSKIMGSATVTVNQVPGSFSFGGGGILTPCITSASIDLISSETNVTYTLYRDGTAVSSKTGTGDLMTWDGLTAKGNYTIIGISDKGCQSGMSGSASITQQAASLSPGGISGTRWICYNSLAGEIKSGSLPTGGAGSSKYQYKWQVSTDDSNWSYITTGGTGTSYSPPEQLTSTHYYRREVYDGCERKYTPSVAIMVHGQLKAGSISGTQNISYNSKPNPLSGQSASGGSGDLKYTWWKSNNNSTWTPVDNINTVSYSPGNLTQSTWYRRQVTDNGGCGSVYTSSVKVSVYKDPVTPAAPIVSYSDGQTVLTKPSAPAYEVYYWQTNSTGMSTSNSSGTKTFTANGTYYLRSYNAYINKWSGVRSESVRVYHTPSTPVAATFSYSDGQTVATKPSAPSGEVYYWQTNSTGMSTSNSSGTKTFTANDTYYLRSYNAYINKWSGVRSESVRVYHTPSTPVAATLSYSDGQTVATKPSAPSGEVYYWQTNSTGMSTSNSSGTKTFTANGTYYLRSYNAYINKWSGVRSESVRVYHTPSTPVAATLSYSDGQTVATKPSAPSGEVYYWQTNSTGMSTSNSSGTKTFTANGTYYLRSYNAYINKWSGVRSKSVQVYHTPSTPVAATFSYSDGQTVATKPSAPSGEVYYWQTNSTGMSTSNSSGTKTFTANGTYYLRSYNAYINKWSGVRSESVRVYHMPSTPVAATLSYSDGQTVATKPSVPSGEVYYWQTNSTGMSTSNSSGTKTFTANGTYYLRSYNAYINKWSGVRSESVRVYHTPSTPVAATLSYSDGQTVATKPSAPSGEVYYWQTNSTGMSTSNSSGTKTFTANGTYYLRSYNAYINKWSGVRSESVRVYHTPSTPVAATLSYSDGQTVATKPSAPSGEVYYWQTNSTGTSILDAASTKAFTSNDTYYLRSYNANIDEWSGTQSGSVTVYTNPSMPKQPEIAVGESKTIVTLAQAPSGETYYWQTSAGGQSTSDSDASKEVLSPTTLYIRSRLGAPSYLWSDALPVKVSLMPTEPVYSDKNYISAITIREEGITDPSSIASLASSQKSETIDYYDGLGRLAQEVQVKASPGLADIVRPVRYDAYGREAMKFLSYPKANSNGAFVATDSTEQAAYYTELHGSADGTTAFAETVFDNSPLNRVMEQGAPGQAWQLAGGHTVKAEYLSNAANEVALYRVDPVTDSLATGTPSWYDAGTLYKTVTKDENWTDQGSAALNKLHTTEEFKDILGRVILKRSYALESGSTTQVDELNTYYVYDDFGLLRYVFPPKAFADGNNSINATEMDSLCYTYKYDGRRRMFEKKLPGAEPVYMLYDKRDRLIAIQDGDMRANSEWEFTKYDALNRPVMIGIKTSSKTRADQQAYLDSYNGVYYESRTSTGIGYTLTQSFADRYTAKEKKLLKVIYYDDYDYPGCKAFDGSTNISGYSDASGDSRYFDNVKGQVTGVREKVLDGNELTTDGVWLASTTYYDDRYRVIETLKDLYPQSSGNYEVSSSKYDFVGDVLLSKTVQSFQGNTDSIREAYSYDHAGRMTQIQYALNNNAPVILSSMEYNELGQLKRKTLNGAPGAGAQELKYAYNIRGWLSQINDPSVAPGSNSTEKFNLALYYNTTPSGLTADPQYNGNISAMVWNTPYNDGALSPTGKQGYGFTYDALNRLLTADYGEGSSFATNAGANNVAITGYDRNGNIMGLTRQLKGTGTIDDLSYAYDGNQLRAVNDAGDRHIGYIEGATPHTVEYTYDENGNLTSDSNKGISGIKYNYLNLPRHMYAGTTKIDYLYTFSGTKVCKLNINGDTIAHYYAGNFVYEGSSLKYILHEEGMVTTPSTSPVYLYDLKDHLGNTRLEVNSSGTVTQQTDYYPFGLAFKIAGSSDNKYLYNGKELQDDAIGNGTLGWYDYGARMYEPEIGRWFVVDPKLELSRRWSPYVYGFDNPIRFIDPDGMWGDDYTGYIQNASPSLRNYNPAKAFIKDISADFLNNFSPLGGIDDAIVTYKNPNATTMDKVNATVEAAVGAVIIVGEGKAPVGEKVGKFETKGGALGQLKRDVKIPRSQQPENVAKEPLRSKGKTVLGGDGKPVMTTEYTHTTTDGNKVVIQDHSAGHTIGNVGPHYNVRPESNTRTGKVSGARTHYEWKNK